MLQVDVPFEGPLSAGDPGVQDGVRGFFQSLQKVLLQSLGVTPEGSLSESQGDSGKFFCRVFGVTQKKCLF